MDAWQIKRQLAYLLGEVRWSDAPADAVLTGAAFVSEDEDGNFLGNPGFMGTGDPEGKSLPFARVVHVADEHDPESPGRVERSILRVFVTAGAGGVAGVSGTNDSHGIDQVTGTNRAASQGSGKSTGRDVDEVITQLINVGLNGGQLTDSGHGMQGEVLGRGPTYASDGVKVLTRSFDVAVYNAKSARFYHGVRRLRVTANSGGSVSLAWSNAAIRYDTWDNVLRHGGANGAAPSTPSSGTDVPLSSGQASSVTVTGLTVGAVYRFSAFVTYGDSVSAVVADRYSDAVSVSVTVA